MSTSQRPFVTRSNEHSHYLRFPYVHDQRGLAGRSGGMSLSEGCCRDPTSVGSRQDRGGERTSKGSNDGCECVDTRYGLTHQFVVSTINYPSAVNACIHVLLSLFPYDANCRLAPLATHTLGLNRPQRWVSFQCYSKTAPFIGGHLHCMRSTGGASWAVMITRGVHSMRRRT